jgi:hypothetical protein
MVFRFKNARTNTYCLVLVSSSLIRKSWPLNIASRRGPEWSFRIRIEDQTLTFLHLRVVPKRVVRFEGLLTRIERNCGLGQDVAIWISLCCKWTKLKEASIIEVLRIQNHQPNHPSSHAPASTHPDIALY